MVKRQDIKKGAVVKVTKALASGAHAGPQFKGTFAVHERLEVLGSPFSQGNINLVKVKRRTTKETIDVIYSFVTHYCKLVDVASENQTPTESPPASEPPPATPEAPPKKDDTP